MDHRSVVPPQTPRSRLLHWSAWAGSVVSAVLLLFVLVSEARPRNLAALGLIDLGLAAGFCIEFFTRTGWKRHRSSYLRWHWFDFIALVPVVYVWDASWPLRTFTMWLVLVCRIIRATDRTLGDGFVQRHALALLNAFEEEISDRVILKILSRVEGEVADAGFGRTAAQALARNKAAVLARIYQEQIKDTGMVHKFAQAVGLQAALEKSEERIFDSIVEMVGSPETDQAIRDVLQSTFAQVRKEIGQRSWRRGLGLRPEART